MGFVLALQFLTRLPIASRGQAAITDRQLAQSMAYFPLVGVLLGLILAGVNWLAAMAFPPGLVAILLIGILVLLTGSLHWDGWMDTADGLLSGHCGQRCLEIMKDSRVGANAVIWGCLGILAEYVLLGYLLHLPTFMSSAWLVASLAWSRWNAVIGTFMFPYARKQGGTAQAFIAEISPREVIISTIIAIAVSVLLVGWNTLALLVLNYLMIMILGKVAEKRLGGITGDILGAMIIAGELIGLFIGGGRI